MKRALTIAIGCAVTTALLAAPAMAGEGNGKARGLAAKQCAAEKKADKAGFKALWGKPAMRNCIDATRDEIAEDRANATEECRAERDEIGEEAFKELYGTNDPTSEHGKKRNAFGKCVSTKVKAAQDGEEEDVTENA